MKTTLHRMPGGLVAVALALLLPAAVAVAQPDKEWERNKRDIERYRGDLIRTISERRAGTDGQISSALSQMTSLLEKSISGCLAKINNRALLDSQKKYLELVKQFDREAMRAGWLPYLQKWKTASDNAARFAKDADAREKKILAELAAAGERLRRDAEQLRSGRVAAVAVLESIAAVEAGIGEAASALDELRKDAADVIAPQARPIAEIKAHIQRAKDQARGGNREMDEVVAALKREVDEALREIDATLKPYNDDLANVLRGAKDHREFNEAADALRDVFEAIRDVCASEKGFGQERAALEQSIDGLTKAIAAAGAFRQADLDAIDAAQDRIAAACRTHRIAVPGWVREGQKILGLLRGRGEEMTRARDALVDVRKEIERFHRDADTECAAAIARLKAADSFAELLAALDDIDARESRFEARFATITDNLREIDTRLLGLERLSRVRGVGEKVIDAILAWREAAAAEVAALRSKLVADAQNEAMLEGYDGD